MSIGSGVLLPGVVENPPFPILRPLAYTTGLGYRPTCDIDAAAVVVVAAAAAPLLLLLLLCALILL